MRSFLKRIADKISLHRPRSRYAFYQGHGDKVLLFPSQKAIAEFIAKDKDLFSSLVYGRAKVRHYFESDAQWRKSH